MDIQKLNLALFTYYQYNFHMLHWKSKGKGFDTAHKDITDQYYNMTFEDIDVLAEFMLRQNINPPSYKEILEILEESDIKVITIDKDENYDIDDVVKYSQKMLEDIVESLIKVCKSDEIQQDVNIGIRAELESMLNKYDLECRYLNKRRS